MLSEEELIIKAQAGSREALAQLLQQNYQFLRNYLLKITLHPQQTEDLTQETMIKSIEKIHLYRFKSKFSTWLMQIGTNLYIDSLRKKKREHNWMQGEQQLIRHMKWSAQQIQREEQWILLLEALQKLSQEARIPVILKYYYDYTYMEIAELLCLPEGTVKSRVFNSIKFLRKEMGIQNEQEA